jgi:molybdopterin synthase sulfur carrier subunit
MIKVLYFARIAEELGTREEEMAFTAGTSAGKLLEQLKQRGEPWQSALSNSKVMIAVNQQMTKGDHALVDNDEVAFFPPVTGG